MFQVSRRADYAMRIMIELGQRTEDANVTAREISRRTAVPKAFLHKIVADLAKASLVRTYSGSLGGLSLAQPAANITALQIIEAIEGPICINVCLLRPHECPRDLVCPAHSLWGRLQAMVITELQQTTLAQLVIEAKNLKQRPQRSGTIPYLFPTGFEQPLPISGVTGQ